jgi:hypothetical protein
MGDCQIVLRFFAFRDVRKIRGSVRSMLDGYMEKNQNMPLIEVEKNRTDFKTRIEFVHKLLGKEAFKLPGRDGKHSRPLFDAIMIAADRMWRDRTKLIKSRRAIRADFATLLSKERNYATIVGKPNTANAIKSRIQIVERYLISKISR